MCAPAGFFFRLDPEWTVGRLLLSIASLPATAALLLAPSTGWGCAVCSCGDPTLTTMGAEQPFAGRLRLAVEATSRSDAVGAPGEDQVLLLDQALTGSVAWSPADRWQVALSVPVGRRTAEDVSLARTTVWAPGDAVVRTRWAALRGTPSRGSALAGLGGGLRLPTAPVVRRPDGTVLPMSAQLGTGTTTATLGGWGFRSVGAWSTYASAEGWVPVVALSPPRDAFPSEPGLSGRATVAGQWQPLRWGAVRTSAEGRLDQPATLNGQDEPDTGGAVLFSRLDLLLTPQTDLVIQAGVSLPVVQALSGHHREGAALALGVTVDL